MKTAVLLASLIPCLVFSQGTDAVLSGTVTDPTGAAVAGTTITVTNTRTGVAIPTQANSTGVYLFPSLQPGVYRITAEHQGFKKHVLNAVTLNIGDKITINLPLEIGTVADSVEVRGDSELALGYNSASVGGVITGQSVQSLPLTSRDAIGLVTTQAGVMGNNFSGAQRVGLNITLDGINVQDNRINVGLSPTLFTSVDRIEEVRVITSPADAEFGRGSGQVQFSSRSGTNEFHGSAFEYLRNKSLNANTFFNNLNGTPRNSLIRNQFGARMGGPILKNKTFFHFLYESQRIRQSSTVTRTVYTPQARQGLFRFFPGAGNANAASATPSVDAQGNPLRPAAATGALQSVSVFGRDPNRLIADPTGAVGKALSLIPLPNNFRAGDGLNTAGYQFQLPSPDDLNQFNFRVDHFFNPRERLSISYNHENEDNPNGFMATPFPGLQGGDVISRTRVLSVGVLSNLSSNLINEFRGGFQRPLLRFRTPWEVNGTEFLPKVSSQSYLLVMSQVTDAYENSNDPQGRISPVYQFSDTVTWLKGKHAFKGGGEVRFVSTNGLNSFSVMPRINLGTGGVSVQNITTIPGIGNNATLAQGMLNDLSGSVNSQVQAFNSPGGANPVFLAGEYKQRTWKTREFSWFFKDEYRASKDLTLNLGVRYEYYGPPFDSNGKTTSLAGGSQSIFGISGTDWGALFQPGVQTGSLTRSQLVAQNSPNADIPLFQPDRNNFAPAVGLAWNVPRIKMLGDHRMVFRMGYQISYERVVSLRFLDVVSGDQPGLREQRTFITGNLLNLGNATLPLSPLGKPLDLVPLTDRQQTVRAFSTNLRSPYVQNFSAGLQTQLTRGVTLDVRYVGSKGTRLLLSSDVNEANLFETGILEAFRITQTGGTSPLMDRLFNGLNVPGVGVVNGTTITGSDAVRRNTTTNAFLAANDAGGFASFLNTNTFITNQRGGIPRRAGFPENWITANPQFSSARLTGNPASSVYHSMQVEVLKRFSSGFGLQSNYTWGKAFGEEEGDGQEQNDNYRTLRNRSLDRRLLSFSVKHAIRNSGTWELPFGRGHRLLGNNHGVVGRLAERWQIGFIYNLFSGTPLDFTFGTGNANTFNNFGGATARNLADISRDMGTATRVGNGVTYFPGLQVVTDPIVQTFSSAFSSRSTLRAVADSSGRVILANPLLGTLGSLGQRVIEGPGSFRLDINLIKQIRINERFSLQLQADATNITNSPQWNNPSLNIDSLNFGSITGTGAARVVVVGMRLNW